MIRVGIIGCGKIAQVRHLPEYAANPHAEVVAYYDKNRARAEEMAAKYGGFLSKNHVPSSTDQPSGPASTDGALPPSATAST